MEAPHPSAVLKNVKGLEFWEWRKDGVLTIELTGTGILSDEDTAKFAGHHVGEEHYALVVCEDVDIYRPRGGDAFELFGDEDLASEEERLLASFRKGVFPKEVTDEAWKNIRGAATVTDNRGLAGGQIDIENTRAKPGQKIVIAPGGVGARVELANGVLSKTRFANFVNSGTVGFFNAEVRNPFCRQTGYTRANPEQVEKAMPFIDQISEQFQRQNPRRWQNQKDFLLNETGIEKNGWTLGRSVFTTVTVNKNFRTAVHQDAGDYANGFGNLTVLEGPGGYEGGYLGFPKFKIAVDVRTGDFLAMDNHQWHGNTQMKTAEGHTEHERISVVCYARYLMKNCETREREYEKYKAWMEKYLTPKQKSELTVAEGMAAAEKELLEEAYLRAIFDQIEDEEARSQ